MKDILDKAIEVGKSVVELVVDIVHFVFDALSSGVKKLISLIKG